MFLVRVSRTLTSNKFSFKSLSSILVAKHSNKSIMTVVSKCWSMDRKKPSLFLTNSSIWRHTDWYENQSCSTCFDINEPNVLQKKEVRRGFRGWSCSKKLYNLLSALWSSTNRFLMDGTSLHSTRDWTKTEKKNRILRFVLLSQQQFYKYLPSKYFTCHVWV